MKSRRDDAFDGLFAAGIIATIAYLFILGSIIDLIKP